MSGEIKLAQEGSSAPSPARAKSSALRAERSGVGTERPGARAARSGVLARRSARRSERSGTEARRPATLAERQRARILDAAERCFIERGFHAASMAHIAATARMSPGLIYRYFGAKNEIVRAIVERHLETDSCPAMQRLSTGEDFCARLLEMFECWRRRDDPSKNAALILELTAEASRDPEILQIVRHKDRAVSRDLTVAVQRAGDERGMRLSREAASVRAMVIQCLFEGLACRVVRNPSLSAGLLRPLLDKVIAALMS